jgi:hypothetical protein
MQAPRTVCTAGLPRPAASVGASTDAPVRFCRALLTEHLRYGLYSSRTRSRCSRLPHILRLSQKTKQDGGQDLASPAQDRSPASGARHQSTAVSCLASAAAPLPPVPSVSCARLLTAPAKCRPHPLAAPRRLLFGSQQRPSCPSDRPYSGSARVIGPFPSLCNAIPQDEIRYQ